jgi:hypothetical protein
LPFQMFFSSSRSRNSAGGLELGEPVGHVMSKRELSRGQ